MGARPDPEHAKEEGRWEGREKLTTNGNCTGRGDDDDKNYAPSNPELETAAAEHHPRIEELPIVQVQPCGGVWRGGVGALLYATPGAFVRSVAASSMVEISSLNDIAFLLDLSTASLS